MTKFEIGLICLIIGFFIRPFVDVTIKIFRNACKEYNKHKHTLTKNKLK
jgi:hypothetical protein